ncbi:MAG: flagellar biosynthesis protein FlhB [Spirochaetales bacterium]|nr:flagellar biosynthesis protein FlhB [Spirochaetales bacterium]
MDGELLKKIWEFRNNPFAGMHIQWFAAEDEGRTEEPTEYKIRKAREDGKVAKSVDLVSAMILLFCIVAIGILSTYMLNTILEMVRFFFLKSGEVDVSKDTTMTPVFLMYFFKLAFPVILVAFIAALIGNVAQVGFFFTAKPLVPDFSKIAPKFGRFFKKAFLSMEALYNFGKSLFKVFLIGILAFVNILSEISKLASAMKTHFFNSFSLVASLAFRIVLQTAILLLVMAIVDYFFQRRQHLESLKMTKQEMKEERKMQEGDPLIKSRLRQRMQEILRRNMLKEVPRADVVITNPTHYAVALKWERLSMVAPKLLAKGADEIARKIREIAKENDIPIRENKPLARALFEQVDIGEMIPEQYWEVVAIILAEVYKTSGRVAEVV